jgi:hypothetical protein
MNKRNIIINSTLAFVTAFSWHQILHELGHFVSAILFYAENVILYHDYVEYDPSALQMTDRIIVAAAGPLVSLFTGLLFHFICSKYNKRNVLFLVFLFMSAFGYINFGGYLLVAPFFTGGDTGFVFNQLGFPFWSILVFALGGALFLFFSIKKLVIYFVEMASLEIINDRQERRTFIGALIKSPVLIGVVVTTLMNLPAPAFLSLLYPMFSPFTLFWVYGVFLKKEYSTLNANKHFEDLSRISPVLIAVIILTVIINRLLVHGFHL